MIDKSLTKTDVDLIFAKVVQPLVQFSHPILICKVPHARQSPPLCRKSGAVKSVDM